MNLIDLVYIVLKALYKRDGNKSNCYSAFEVWSYLLNIYPDDFDKLGYDRVSFTQFDMDTEVLTLLGSNSGVPFRVHREPTEDGLFLCDYWIP